MELRLRAQEETLPGKTANLIRAISAVIIRAVVVTAEQSTRRYAAHGITMSLAVIIMNADHSIVFRTDVGIIPIQEPTCVRIAGLATPIRTVSQAIVIQERQAANIMADAVRLRREIKKISLKEVVR